MVFNQLKHYLKLNKKVLQFDEIKLEVRKAFSKIKPENYKSYFLYSYQKDKLVLPSKKSTRRREPKIYKD